MKPETANNTAAGAPQRRVGTVTMGVTMIVAGVGMLCRLMGWIQPETLLNLCRFAPLLLVSISLPVKFQIPEMPARVTCSAANTAASLVSVSTAIST